MKAIIKMINLTPTAYDVGKVVEQLEDEKNHCSIGCYEDYDDYEQGKYDAYDYAIEIVKKRGGFEMSRYINLDDDRLLQILYDEACAETIYKKMCEIADADVQPVRHGKWTEQEEPYTNTYGCSNCGEWFTLDYGTPEDNNYNYCPNCGAKMEGEE